MKSIKITEEPKRREIETTKPDQSDTISIRSLKLKESEKRKYHNQQDKKDKKYEHMFNFRSKYHYFVFLIMFQNSNEMIPIAIRHILTFSGGKLKRVKQSIKNV